MILRKQLLCSLFLVATSSTKAFVRPTCSRPVLLKIASQDDEENEEGPFEKFISNIAKLSLKDYEWRSNIFKTNQADRQLEQAVARLSGKDASYLRPMDASEAEIGPLGRWEKSTVQWLADVIDEEGKRAKTIVNRKGKLVRPLDADELGPLGLVEKKMVDLWRAIRNSEQERARSKTLRPKDLDEELRGPLGRMEDEAVRVIEEIQQSERLRMEQSKRRGGAMVRPMDVPGPLGEFEIRVAEIFEAEKRRATRERERNAGKIVRPKDASQKGPLGEAELQATDIIRQLSSEEKARLLNLGRFLQEKRPMENDRSSFLGYVETVVVGLLRAPTLVIEVVQRVQELLASEKLDDQDLDRLEQAKLKDKEK